MSLRAALLCRCFDDLCYTCVRSRVDDDTHIHWTLCIHINTCVVAGAHSLSVLSLFIMVFGCTAMMNWCRVSTAKRWFF